LLHSFVKILLKGKFGWQTKITITYSFIKMINRCFFVGDLRFHLRGFANRFLGGRGSKHGLVLRSQSRRLQPDEDRRRTQFFA
jgi:hypothetical protein